MSSQRRELSSDAVHASAALPLLDELPRRLQTLADENEALGRELLRCYEQLSLVFEITEHIAHLEDPKGIQEGLLRRYATMLASGAVYVVHAGACRQVETACSTMRQLTLPAEQVLRVLHESVEEVRQAQRARVPMLRADQRAALGDAHVLLGAIRQFNDQPAVVIALRDAAEPAFDSGDMLASESVLGYGGHVLSNVLMLRHVKQTALETVCALANAIDAKDNYTSGHSERVGWLARLTGKALGLPGEQLQMLEWAGLLHDVGKIGVPEAILNKPGRLTPEEFAEIKKHPRMSYEVLKPVASLEPVLPAVLYHHENHDGSGYPDGLVGEEIPLGARVIHVVDIFDALTSSRSYRAGFSLEGALEILTKDSGRVTEPEVTRIFIDTFTQYRQTQRNDFRRRFGHIRIDADSSTAPSVPASAPPRPEGP